MLCLDPLAARRLPLVAAPRATSSPNLNMPSPRPDASDDDGDDDGQSDLMDSWPPHCPPARPYDTNRWADDAAPPDDTANDDYDVQ